MTDAVHEIQVEIDDAKAAVAKADQLQRLHDNPDFAAVLLEGYFKDHAAQLVAVKAHPAMQSPDQQASILRSIEAIGELQQYFSGIFQQGNMQAEAIRQAEAELETLAQEGEL